ncbi:acetyl-CoA C-acyltransferase, partial [Bacillus cereus]|nr:acetyl-CoA C-acyltransferase [Bacillus cereus]
MHNFVITAAVRSPIGNFGGALKNVTPVEVAVPVLQEAVKRGGVEPHAVDEVLLGHCIQRNDEANTARPAAVAAGFPDTVTGY